MKPLTRIQIQKMALSAMLFAVGMVLPFLTMQIKEIGDSLLPMHLPVMLCGLLCGWKYGGVVGFFLPLLRSVSFGMPPIYPHAVYMALELMTYGIVIGIVYSCFGKKRTVDVLIALIAAMLIGRVVWGISKAILLGLGGNAFTVQMFLVSGFLDAIPGIVLQLLLIPSIMALVKKLRKGDI